MAKARLQLAGFTQYLHSTFRMVDDSSPKRVGITPGAESHGLRIGCVSMLEFCGAEAEKSGTPERAAQNEKAGCVLEDRATSPVLHTNRR